MAKAKKWIFLLLAFGCVSFLSFQAGALWQEMLLRGNFGKLVIHVFQEARDKAVVSQRRFGVGVRRNSLEMDVSSEIESLIPMGVGKDKLLKLLEAEFQFQDDGKETVCGEHIVESWLVSTRWYRLCFTFDDGGNLSSLKALNSQAEAHFDAQLTVDSKLQPLIDGR